MVVLSEIPTGKVSTHCSINHAYLSIEKYPKTQITKFEKSAFVRYQYLLNYSLYLLVKVFLQTAPKNYGSLKRDNSGVEDIDGRDKY